jgi:sporulation protein YlmC with PRC-barrel domain
MRPIIKPKKPVGLGMPVQTLDGKAGSVIKIIADPESRRPLYLAIKTGRLGNRREVVVPASLVSSASEETATLAVSRKKLLEFPVYEVTLMKGEYKKPEFFPRSYGNIHYFPSDNSGYVVVKQRSIPDHLIAVEKGMQVVDCDGNKVGKLKDLIMDQEQRQGKFIVLGRDHFSPLQMIPSGLVQDVSSAGIKLSIAWDSVEKLPEYTQRAARSLLA